MATNHDALAQCLTERGVKMYGAFWCPHCAAQKEAFGESFQYVTYVECSNEDRTQNETCNAAGITGYPTWILQDGERLRGEQTLQVLAERSGC